MDKCDDSCLDNNKSDKPITKLNKQQFKSNQNTKQSSKLASNNKTQQYDAQINHPTSKNKKAKRLPWNTQVLEDRFTPQSYQVQLIDACLNNLTKKTTQSSLYDENLIIFLKNAEYKNYLLMMCIKQFAFRMKKEHVENHKQRKLMLLITNMGSDVSKYVDIVSRHTTLKIAGIDLNIMNANNYSNNEFYFNQLKNEAQILIMSINILIEWFKKEYLKLSEIMLILFDDVNAAFHNNSYKTFMDSFYNDFSSSSSKFIGFGELGIEKSTTYIQIKQHIDYLKELFKCNYVETATDLLDTQNLFYGHQPKECIQICENANLLSADKTCNSFQSSLVDKIKESFMFLESINASTSNTNENLNYIHLLCVRVLNECVYLLNEVGIWCLAKSLLPFICQIDKLSLYIENSSKNHQPKNLNEQTETISNGMKVILLNNPNLQQRLILQYTSTFLKQIREICIKEFLGSKSQCHNTNYIDYFLSRFATPKIKSLVNLLRKYQPKSDEFCCLIFVQNKQVATSLSLLLKKLAKEDPKLNYLFPNYVIGPGNPATNNSKSKNFFNKPHADKENISDNGPINDGLKQEEILRKFYSGEINLLICTYEMEEHITSPSCVNLIIRFNCSVNTETNSNSGHSNDQLPFDYFSFIGTKTRARSKNASCYFFIEKNYFDSFFRQFSNFKQIENTLIKNYSKLINENAGVFKYTKERDELSISEWYKPNTERFLSLENSIYLLNRYCIRLPSDALTQLTPRFQIKTRLVAQNTDNEYEYKCYLYLPINSSIREAIQSDWEKSIELAKVKAAFKACLILYLRNELNDMLEPISKEMFYKLKHKSDEDDEREWSQFSQIYQKHSQTSQELSNYMSHRPGGNKRKQVYKKKVSPYLHSFQLVNTQHQSYLYMIRSTVTVPLAKNINDANIESSGNKFEKNSSNWCFGMITSKILLEIVDFPIFTQNGEETITFELLKSSIYLTPNQLKLLRNFHKFIFSSVLRMENRGTVPSPFLLNINLAQFKSQLQSYDQYGYYMAILKEDENKIFDFDWDLMKKVEECTDKTFMKVPSCIRKISDEEETVMTTFDEEKMFKFESEKYADAVVIPFYRNNDTQPQFYCVSSIDFNSTPLSPFPVSSHKTIPNYATFYEYFALKYDILLTNLKQPLLYVSHPSTRLNLLTPRYMNLKASVIQKSYVHPVTNHKEKESSSNKIYLIPELVNVHPFTATIWRRCLCLPSILYRLNSLLVAEELRREIARASGVGLPWISDTQKFDKLSFAWDTKKEIEICDVPDVEVDILSIKNEVFLKEQSEIAVDPNWNFEISAWDDSCLKEVKKTSAEKNKSKFDKIFKFPNSLNKVSASSNGWCDDDNLNPKTLFIDPNDMDFFGGEYADSDMDEDYDSESKSECNNHESKMENFKIDHFDMNLCKTNTNEDDYENENDEFDIDNDEAEFNDDHINDTKEMINGKMNKHDELNLKFTIDMNTLKADMKKKSAKLLSKLSVNSNNCSLVKSLVKKNSDQEFTNETTLKNDHQSDKCIDETKSIADLERDYFMNSADEYSSNLGILRSIDEPSLGQHKQEQFDLNQKHINDWFFKIDFKFDLGEDINNQIKCSNSDPNNQLLARIKNKYLISSQNNLEEIKINNLIDCTIFNEDKIKLPLKKNEIEKILADFKDSIEVDNKITTIKSSEIANPNSLQPSLRNTDWTFHYFLDDYSKEADFSNQLGPGPALLLQALTLSNAADGFDLERLETVGDSFLKQAITVYLFFTYPNVHEGKLSYMRSKQVSNYNLYKLGKRRGLHELLISTKFEPLDSWLPSHYDSVVSREAQNASKAKPTPNTITSISSEIVSGQIVQIDKYKEHLVSDKSIADSVEAIIGAYLITSGPHAALQIMSWFGLEVLPKVKSEDGTEILVNIPYVSPPKINNVVKLEELIDGFSTFEACIGYKFKHPAYLLQAFTHASYTYNTITDCYQRLEFLGDAILDYVITRHLYEDKQKHSPGELTDLRSSLVNNNIFAYLAVKYEFYKYFKYFSPTLYTIIEDFVQNQKQRNDEFDLEEDFFDYPIDDDDDEEFLLMQNADTVPTSDLIGKSVNDPASEYYNQQGFNSFQTNELEEMEVPKCLGDIFESVAGAIYLDSNKSFDTVWRVYYGLMKPHIDKFTSKVPKSPIRELFELEPETAKFEKPERTIDGKIKVTVSVFGRGKFKGVGRNYRIAKNAAAKLALKFLKNQKN